MFNYKCCTATILKKKYTYSLLNKHKLKIFYILKLRLKRNQESSNVWHVKRSFLVKTVFTTIRRFMINPTLTSVKSAQRYVEVNPILIFIIGHIQVKNHSCVLFVKKDFRTNLIYENIRQFTMTRENSYAQYVLREEVIKLKMNWVNTWYFITNRSSLVQSVVKSFIDRIVWNDMKNKIHANSFFQIWIQFIISITN